MSAIANMHLCLVGESDKVTAAVLYNSYPQDMVELKSENTLSIGTQLSPYKQHPFIRSIHTYNFGEGKQV